MAQSTVISSPIGSLRLKGNQQTLTHIQFLDDEKPNQSISYKTRIHCPFYKKLANNWMNILLAIEKYLI